MKKITMTITLLIVWSINIFSQDSSSSTLTKSSIFIGYDLGEMAFNKFQNFGGEIGYKFKNDHTLSFVYLNVKLTEGHLSSGFANAVDGNNVTGLWHAYDLYYNLPIFRFKNGTSFVYGGLTAGYQEHLYQHTSLEDSVENKTATIGFDIGLRETNIFKVKGLYINLQIPFGYNFIPQEETKLGDATVNKSVFDQTISFFVGYEF